MDFEELYTFLEIIKYESFSKTADVLHVAQSTISNRIKSLEDYVGANLIVRDKTGLRLTKEGEIFYRYANQLMALKNNAIRDINISKGLNDVLSIASTEWIYNSVLRDKIYDYKLQNPNIGINLDITHSADISELLKHNACDIALSPNKFNNANYISQELFSSDIILVASSEKYSQYKDGIEKRDLSTLPLLFLKIWELYLHDFFSDFILDPVLFNAKLNSFNIAKKFCLSGAGFCFLPKILVENELEEGSLINIPISEYTPVAIKAYLVVNKTKLTSPNTINFFNFIFGEQCNRFFE